MDDGRSMEAGRGEHVSRRAFLGGAAVAGVAMAGWVPGLRLPAASADDAPPGFPRSVALYRQTFENWSGETMVEDVWTCAPASAADVVAVANWAWPAGYAIRPRGYMHNWAPFTITNAQRGAKIVLLDTTQHLLSMEMLPGSPAAVRAGTGTTMVSLLGFLESHGYGITSVPAVGPVSLGGVLAIDGHGAATRADGEIPGEGAAYGSVSNLVLSLDAVVWNPSRGRYELETFERADPRTKALMTHLGRTFVVAATLQVTRGFNLRCQSFTDVSTAELFAPPSSAGPQSFGALLARTGRVEAILYPFTKYPWLKVWSVAPTKPAGSRETNQPYNYPFSDLIPSEVAFLVNEIIRGNVDAAPLLGELEYAVTAAGLPACLATDLWGPAKNTQLYITASTLRLAEGGGVVLCRRADVQRVGSEFVAKYNSLVTEYQAKGQYPMNGPVEIRATGLDHGADAPALSALHARADHPEWDTGLWTNMLTIPGTAQSSAFYAEMEAWVIANYTYAGCRVEWSKGWAHTPAGAWTDTNAMTVTIPDDFRVARGANDNWDWALATLDALDPHRIYSNPLLDVLAP